MVPNGVIPFILIDDTIKQTNQGTRGNALSMARRDVGQQTTQKMSVLDVYGSISLIMKREMIYLIPKSLLGVQPRLLQSIGNQIRRPIRGRISLGKTKDYRQKYIGV